MSAFVRRGWSSSAECPPQCGTTWGRSTVAPATRGTPDPMSESAASPDPFATPRLPARRAAGPLRGGGGDTECHDQRYGYPERRA